jgi:hypothetical protein
VCVVLPWDRVCSTNLIVVLSSQSATVLGPRSRVIHLASPVQTANVSARRCVRPTLSQSPARSGHSTCMRKIFDDPLRPLALRQRHHDVIYPPLPNVSSHLQLSGNRLRGHVSASSLHRLPPQERQSGRDQPRVLARSASRSPSESWSDASIYVEAETVHASPGLAASPYDQVQDWLSTMIYDGDIGPSNKTAGVVDGHLNRPMVRDGTSIMHNNIISNETGTFKNDGAVYLPCSQRQIFDTCKTFDFDQPPPSQAHKTVGSPIRFRSADARATYVHVTPIRTRKSSCREDPELSPLSPNVCTERGPSEYRRPCTAEIAAGMSSASSRLPFRYQRRFLKENVALGDGTSMPEPSKGLRDRRTVTHDNT